MQAGTFPKPIRLGAKAVGWLESEVLDWIESAIADTPRRTASTPASRRSRKLSGNKI